MADNESLLPVPSNVAEPLALRKFLVSLIEKLDIILGYRGQDPYVSKKDFLSTAELLTTLPATVKTLQDSDTKQSTDIAKIYTELGSTQDSVSALQQVNNITVSLVAAYYDFNYTGYGALAGWYEFTALGSAITNPPVALVPATSYTVLIHNCKTSGGGMMQEVYITSATTKTYHKRAGGTFALALSLGWF